MSEVSALSEQMHLYQTAMTYLSLYNQNSTGYFTFTTLKMHINKQFKTRFLEWDTSGDFWVWVQSQSLSFEEEEENNEMEYMCQPREMDDFPSVRSPGTEALPSAV